MFIHVFSNVRWGDLKFSKFDKSSVALHSLEERYKIDNTKLVKKVNSCVQIKLLWMHTDL